MNWPLVTLGEICTTTQGVQITKANTSDTEYKGGYRYLYIADFISEKKLSFVDDIHDQKKVTNNDLVMANTGSPGRVFKGKDGILSNNLFKITFDSNVVDRDYLYLMLASDVFQIHLQGQMKGGIQKHLGHQTISRQEIPLPPLAEQKRIAAILDKADAIRRKRQQTIQLADDFLRAVFLDMFGDPVTNPKGLKKVPITELADVITGFAFKSKEYTGDSQDAVRLCRGANTLTGYFDWSDTVYWPKNKLEKLDLYFIKTGDVILAMDRPWISSGLKVCIFPKDQRATYLVQRVARLRPKDQYFTDYIYSCIKSQAFEKHCCPTETTVPHISPIELKNFDVLLPDSKLMGKYHSIVSTTIRSLNQMTIGKSNIENMFYGLSQKAFSGKL